MCLWLNNYTKKSKKRSLLVLSEFEQIMICTNEFSFTEASKSIDQYFTNPSLYNDDLLRIVILFALRYETHKDMKTKLVEFIASLKNRSVPDSEIRAIDMVLRYGGVNSRRTESLFDFSKGDIVDRIKLAISDKGMGLSEVSNVYTQHKPLFHKMIEQLIVGKLSQDNYPFQFGTTYPEKPQQILIFILGGITFEDACYIAERNNREMGNLKILLGGTSIHNSHSFLRGLVDSQSL